MEYNIKDKFRNFKSGRYSASYLAKIAILTALSFILYAFGKFNLPVIFPSFLEIQISELPALLAGFSMGPLSGCIVIVLKCLFKFPLSSTQFVGEATDILLGIAFVLPASLIYHIKKDKKHAVIGLVSGVILTTLIAILVNRFISIPFYVTLYFNGNFDIIVSIVQPLYKDVTMDTFYKYYLLVGVLPFNLLRGIIVSVLTFVLYKRLSKILHWDGHSMKKQTGISGTYESSDIEDTYSIAAMVEKTLNGGEIILLEGDLGAGKTTFTKGLAKALGIEDEVTSPTFTILNIYEDGRLQLNHLDMYRIESEDELYELGIEETTFNNGITVIEWNKYTSLTGRIISVKINYVDDNTRTFIIEDSEDKNVKGNRN